MPESTDPTFYRSPAAAIAAPPETARLRRGVRPGRRAARRDDRGRLRRRLAHLRRGGRLDGAADRGQRAAPLRLERLLQRALPRGPRRRARAPLPDRAGHPLVAHLRARHQARSAAAAGRPHDRARGARRQGRLLPPAHRALRARRHLHVQPGRRRRQRRPGRGGAHRPRHLRGHRRLGDGPGRAALRLRRVVAPQRRRRHHVGVGDPVDDRERAQPRGPPGEAVRPPPQLLEPLRRQADPARRPGRRASDGARAAAGSRSRQDLGLRRGRDQRRGSLRLGVAVAPRWRPVGGEEGDHDPRRARRGRPSSRPRFSPSARFRRW